MTALQPQNSGSDDDTLWQPKFGLAYLINENLDLYANYGQGFHSNDVRAAVNRIDPVSGDPTDQQPILADQRITIGQTDTGTIRHLIRARAISARTFCAFR